MYSICHFINFEEHSSFRFERFTVHAPTKEFQVIGAIFYYSYDADVDDTIFGYTHISH